MIRNCLILTTDARSSIRRSGTSQMQATATYSASEIRGCDERQRNRGEVDHERELALDVVPHRRRQLRVRPLRAG